LPGCVRIFVGSHGGADVKRHRFYSQMIKVLSGLAILCAPVSARQMGTPESATAGWKGIVRCEGARAYARMSAASRVVTVLSKGEAIDIDLEVSGTDGVWYSFIENNEMEARAYVRGECIRREPPAQVSTWRMHQPPALPASPRESALVEEAMERRLTRDEIQLSVEKALDSRLGALAAARALSETSGRPFAEPEHRESYTSSPGYDGFYGGWPVAVPIFVSPRHSFPHTFPNPITCNPRPMSPGNNIGVSIHAGPPPRRP
jgi:hypothetical protein